MRIVLSMRVTNAVGYDEPRDSISHDWIRWLEQFGHTPLLVPNILSDAGGYVTSLNADALILTGGNDVIPSASGTGDFAPRRNQTEETVLATAIAAGMPVFAVCRGLHVVNQYFGGDIVADISGSVVKHVSADHPIHLEEPFIRITEARDIITNSFHNQAVTLDGVAPDLRVMAASRTDGLAEGLVHPDLPILAIQWHPERPNPAAAIDALLFDRLLTQGPFWRDSR